MKEAGWGEGYLGFEIDLAPLFLDDEFVVVRIADSMVQIGEGPVYVPSRHTLLPDSMPDAYMSLIRQAVAEVQVLHVTSPEWNRTR